MYSYGTLCLAKAMRARHDEDDRQYDDRTASGSGDTAAAAGAGARVPAGSTLPAHGPNPIEYSSPAHTPVMVTVSPNKEKRKEGVSGGARREERMHDAVEPTYHP